jgi:hypothetical protein
VHVAKEMITNLFGAVGSFAGRKMDDSEE